MNAEKHVIGALLNEPKYLGQVMGIIQAEDFSNSDHKIVFQAIIDLDNKADIVTVSEAIETLGCGLDISDLGDYTFECVDPSNVSAYAGLVKEASLKRKIHSIAYVIQDGIEQKRDSSELLNDIGKAISAVGAEKVGETQGSLGNALKELLDDIQQRMDGSSMAYSTGITELDKFIQFEPGGLYLVGGQSGMGKTTIVQRFMEAQFSEGTPIFFASLEMPKKEVAKRFLQSYSKLDSNLFREPAKFIAHNDNSSKITAGFNALKDKPIQIDDQPQLSLTDIKVRCRNWMMQQERYTEGKRGMLVIDYIQIMDYDRKAEVSELARITAGLKAFAKEMKIPVIGLVQLNRNNLNRGKDDKLPILSDIKGSSAMAADSDGVIFGYRPDYENPDSDQRGLMFLRIGKHRNGPTGDVTAKCDMKYFNISDLNPEYDYQG